MASRWTLPERHLLTELAKGLARRLFTILKPAGDGDHIGPDYVGHAYASDFTTGCDVLWRLGLAQAAYGPEPKRNGISHRSYLDNDIQKEKIGPPCFRFFTTSEIQQHMLTGPNDTTPSHSEILTTYLKIACNYGLNASALSSRREPFIPQPEYSAEIRALGTAGYLEKSGTTVQWTDKIAPAMQAAYLWQADGGSNATLAEAELAQECKTALERTPAHTRSALAKQAKRLSELDFAILLRDRFDGLYWRKDPDGSLRPRTGNVRLLKAVYRALRENY